MFFLREVFPSYVSSLISLKSLYWVTGLVNFLSGIFVSWIVNSEKMVNIWSYPSPSFSDLQPPINAYPPFKLPIKTTPNYWHSVKPSTPPICGRGGTHYAIFPDIVWIDKLHKCVEGICFNV